VRASDDRVEPGLLISQLRSIVGSRHVLTDPSATKSYRSGYRFGEGAVLAVVLPQSLVALWRTIEACVASDAIVIMQAANTGLTGGSTPDGDDYDRDVILVNAMAIDGIHLIRDGQQVVCLPGATLNALEKRLEPIGREPHSVIGSSCFGASVIGGVCNNSGGALVRRGPAYTELALYAKLGADGALSLVNALNIELGDGPPQTLLERLDKGDFETLPIKSTERRASDQEYEQHVRDVTAPSPARFNADPRRLSGASGSAGRIVVFAVRLDTFARETSTVTLYVGTNNPKKLSALRLRLLTEGPRLPISAEYLHRHAFDLAAVYGKDAYLAIRWFGTRRLPEIARLKQRIDRLAESLGLGHGFSDRCLQRLFALWPSPLPRRLWAWRERFEHHLLLKVDAGDAVAVQKMLRSELRDDGDVLRCSRQEAESAFLHRFVTAGASVRYRLVHSREVENVIALDFALPRNAEDWVVSPPAALTPAIVHHIVYGHFLCHVFHHDFLIAKDEDVEAIERALCELLDARGAEYPAEHNVGHLYRAKPALRSFYHALDPRNMFNPGVGRTTKRRDWSGADDQDRPDEEDGCI
jgi:D-lactate dehydrogenase